VRQRAPIKIGIDSDLKSIHMMHSKRDWHGLARQERDQAGQINHQAAVSLSIEDAVPIRGRLRSHHMLRPQPVAALDVA